MKHKLLIALIAPTLFLTACDRIGHNVNRAGDSLTDSYDNMRYRMAQYIYHTDVAEVPPVPYQPPASFCYKVLMDIICYDRPRPDLHLTLVAVQGEHAFAYQDFMPMPAGDTQNRFYKALYAHDNNHMVYDNAYDGDGDDITPRNDAYIAPIPRAKAQNSDIIVKDLGGSQDGTFKTPFHHSPSPAAKDNFDKPIEPFTDIETIDKRTRLAPKALIEQ